jgi:D-sedoheptulose 7-phosphate isomerase
LTGPSLLTALANDEGYERCFAAPIEAFGRAGDVALAVSTSGNSPNLVRAFEVAKQLGLHRAALLGFKGGRLGPLADPAVVVACDSVPMIEDAHLMINHMLTEAVRDLLAHEVQT